MRFSWLHISDLHFPSEDTDSIQIDTIRRIVDNVASIIDVDKATSPTFLFVTGDLIHRASGTTYTQRVKSAIQQFRNTGTRIRHLAKELNIAPSNIFIVPGNHDVVWNTAPSTHSNISDLLGAVPIPDKEDIYSDNFRDIYTRNIMPFSQSPDNSPHTEDLAKSLQPYLSFARTFSFARNNGKRLGHFYDDGTFWCTRSGTGYQNGTDIGIVGLNSAWACSQIANHLPMLPTGISYQLDRTLEGMRSSLSSASLSAPDIIIGLVHHPFGWILPYERPAFQRKCHKDLDVLLRGHEHVDWINQYGSSLLEISAPAVHQSDYSTRRGFSFVEFDSLTRRCRVFLREYLHGSEIYTPTNTKPNRKDVDARPESFNQLVQLSNGRLASTPNRTSHAFMRRFGYSSDELLPADNGIFSGAILVLDIFAFSSMSIDHQIESVRLLWKIASLACEDFKEPSHFAFMPLPDGLVIGIIDDNNSAAARTASYLAKYVINKFSDSNILPSSINLRGAVGAGDFSVLLQHTRESAIVTGSIVNSVRKTAYMADPNTVCMPSALPKLISKLDSTFSDDFGIKKSYENPCVSLSMTLPPALTINVVMDSLDKVRAFRSQKHKASSSLVDWTTSVSRWVNNLLYDNKSPRPLVDVQLAVLRHTPAGQAFSIIPSVTKFPNPTCDIESHDMSRILTNKHGAVFYSPKFKYTHTHGNLSRPVSSASQPPHMYTYKRKRLTTVLMASLNGDDGDMSMAIPVAILSSSVGFIDNTLAKTFLNHVRTAHPLPLDNWRALHAIYA